MSISRPECALPPTNLRHHPEVQVCKFVVWSLQKVPSVRVRVEETADIYTRASTIRYLQNRKREQNVTLRPALLLDPTEVIQ